MPFSVIFLASLTLSYLPLSLSYRDGARSESCYNMLVMHTDFLGNVVSPTECGNTCPYELSVMGRVNAENTSNPTETTYQFGETYHLQLTSTPRSIFEGFMVEARESTEAFDSGGTIWGTWVTDLNQLGSGYNPSMNLFYHTVECNRSLTSSEGPFENAATHNSPADLTSLDLYWRAPPPPNSAEEYLQLPQQIGFWFITVQQRLTYFYHIAGPTLNRECSIPGLECLNNGTFNCTAGTCDCRTGFSGSDCSVVVCTNLTNPDNGQVDTPQGTTLNQVATYSCNDGYLLVGSMRRTCQANGMWSGNEPFCFVDCGALTNPDNGQVDTPQGTTLNQVANYSCNDGYLLVGSMTRTCQADGMWSGNEPFCQLECLNGGTFDTGTEICDCPTGFTGSNCSVVDCGALTNPDNGQVDTPQGTTLNQVATYSCNNGYLLVGSMRRTCQENGMWSGNEPFCQLECLNNGTFNNSTEICDCPTGFTGSNCSVIDCGALTNPYNGRVNTPQGMATYSCNNGYLLVGNMTRTCQENGMWSGNEPFCQLMCQNGGTFNTSIEICDCPTGFTGSNCSVVDCGALTNPDNGQVDTPQGTTLNQVATYSCNDGYLLVESMRRTCQADGMWSGNEPFCQLVCLNGGTFNTSTETCDCPTAFTGSNCSVISTVTRDIQNIGEIEVNSENAQDVINNLTMSVELADENDQTGINFAVITKVIVNASAIVALAQTGGTAAIPLQQRVNITMNVVQIVDSVSMWPVSVTNTTSPRIVQAFEVIVASIVQDENFNNLLTEGNDVALLAERVVQEDLELNGRTFGASRSDDGQVLASVDNDTVITLPEDQDASISLPPSLFAKLDPVNTTEVGIGFTFYETAALFPLPEGSPSNLTIGSSVIGALVGGQSFSDLQDPVTIFLRLTHQNFNPQCTSWNFSAAGGRGNWTTDGCELNGTVGNIAICECNHLTNFAVLVDICTRIGDCQEIVLPSIEVALTVITITGTSLSLFGLTITIITLLVFKKLRKRVVSKFHIQLCIALFCMLIVFVSGIYQTHIYGGCVTVSALIHYFTLVTWMWMGAEAVLMFQKLVFVFGQVTTRYIIAVSLVCWLVPIVPVVIPLAIDRNFMLTFSQNNTINTAGTTDMDPIRYCFIGASSVFFGAFLVPIFAILVFNSIIFVIVMSILAKQIHKKFANKNQQKVVRLMISMMGVMALFGLTWVFGAFTVREASTAFQFLFAIFNSLQGFFIFLFFCVLGKEGRELWLHVLCCGRKIPGVTVPTRSNVKSAKDTVPRKPSEPDSFSTSLKSGYPTSNQSSSFTLPSTVFSEHNNSLGESTVKANPMALQLEAIEESHTNEPQFTKDPSAERKSRFSHSTAEESQMITEVSDQNGPVLVRCRSTIRRSHHVQIAEIYFGDNEDESDM